MKKKRRITLLIIGLLLAIIPYFINTYSVYRLLSILVGLIIIQIALIINKKNKVWRIVIFPIIFLCLAFGIDYGIAHIFKNIPIFANEIKSSDKVKTYNSVFYRMYSCNQKF